MLMLCSVCATRSASAETVEYHRQILPLLSHNCYPCHGPDEHAREAELRLDTDLDALAASGILTPGAPADSELYQRITSDDTDLQMPPPTSEYRLNPEQIALIEQWIQQGAEWQRHWAFVPPVRPDPPPVQNADWCQNEIDRLVLARLEAKGWLPSPRAKLATLVRRLYLDLTGLPPTVCEVHALLADPSPAAVEQLVDRLLDSPHYGEHMARYWLDAARYADTHGLHIDNYREMWPYRDYVIRAFNDNLPYDRFLVEQLAGDLLPDPTLEQLIASGFNRCHVTTNEGGSIAEEVYVRNVIDRVSTFGTATMGLTLGCCVCHDHKFDPFTQQDFYQLFAYFNSLDGPEMDGNTKHPAPYVRVPSADQQQALRKIAEQIEQLRHQNKRRLISTTLPTSKSLAKLLQQAGFQESPRHDFSFDSMAKHKFEDLTTGKPVGTLHGAWKSIKGRQAQAIQLADDGYADLGDLGELDEDKPFSIAVWVKLPANATGTILAKIDVRDLEKGYQLAVDAGHAVVELNGRWPGYAIRVSSRQPVIAGDVWQHVVVTYDASKLACGVQLFVDGQSVECDMLCDSLHQEGSINAKVPLQLGRRDQDPTYAGLAIDELKFYDRRLREDELRLLYLADQLAEPNSPPASWSAQQQQAIRELSAIVSDNSYRSSLKQIDELRQQQIALLAQLPTSPIFREARSPTTSFLLVRGQYDQHGRPVQREVLKQLLPAGSELSRDRLGLAHWLTADDHPLTSRVAVNRIWQQLFGTGLVESSEDFGLQGTPPTHPQLLDWLACEFRDSGWDVKALVKQIVLSATYQQSSRHDFADPTRDPKNRLLSRGPRFRLDAEVLRDQALAVSGLLVEQVGGPSVKPPQPAGLWQAVAFVESDTAKFQADTQPEKIHRRSLYTFWKRTASPPQLGIFDAPSREACTMRRERTNSPLQALLLMNDPQYLEAARHLATRILSECSGPPPTRLRWAFEQVTLRAPTPAEVEQLHSAYRDFATFYAAHPEAAQQLIQLNDSASNQTTAPTELAPWMMIANTLLNLDEVVTKE